MHIVVSINENMVNYLYFFVFRFTNISQWCSREARTSSSQ